MTNTKPAPVEKIQKQLATRQARLVKQIAKAVKIADKAGSTYAEQEALYIKREYKSMAPSLKGYALHDYDDSYHYFCNISSTKEDITRTERDLVRAIAKQVEKDAKTAAKVASELGLRMTCQVCGRDIQSNRGDVAHHGYQRPGDGWQTSSCMGALNLPLEADYKVLGQYIGMLIGDLETAEVRRAAIDNEVAPIPFSYTARYKDEQGCRQTKEVTGVFTRETFDVVKVEHAYYCLGIWSFDDVKKREISRLDRGITDRKSYIGFQRARLEAAKTSGVTHKHNNETGHWEPK